VQLLVPQQVRVVGVVRVVGGAACCLARCSLLLCLFLGPYDAGANLCGICAADKPPANRQPQRVSERSEACAAGVAAAKHAGLTSVGLRCSTAPALDNAIVLLLLLLLQHYWAVAAARFSPQNRVLLL
jgi:hypothetical protein